MMEQHLIVELHHSIGVAVNMNQQIGDEEVELVHEEASSDISDIYDSLDFDEIDDDDDNDDNSNSNSDYNHNDESDELPTTTVTTIPQHEKNKLYESLPSLEWSEAVDTIKSQVDNPSQHHHHDCHLHNNLTKSLFQQTFDRRFGQETKSQAFKQLHVLDDLTEERCNGKSKREMYQQRERRISFDEEEEDCSLCNEDHVINSRRSQLKRRIFKLQGDAKFDDRDRFMYTR